MGLTWMDDKREASCFIMTEGELTYRVKVTPDRPGGSRHILTCMELPGWEGKCVYAYPDPRDNSQFQFRWQTERLRAAGLTSPTRTPPNGSIEPGMTNKTDPKYSKGSRR